MLSNRLSCLCGLAPIVTLASVVSAAPPPTLTPFLQTRSVHIDILDFPQCNNTGSAGDTAVAFEPFNTLVPLQLGCAAANISTAVSQQSQISASFITAGGGSQFSASGQAPGGHAGSTISAVGSSSFSVTFVVPVASRFVINSTLVADADSFLGAVHAGATMMLVHELPNQVVILSRTVDRFSLGQPDVFSATGDLVPGNYSLIVRADTLLDDSVPPAAHGNATYDVSFLLVAPCSSDFNGDGVVDGTDLAFLLGSWGMCGLNPTLCPDVTGDGVVDGADLATLLGQWGPCP